MSSNHRFLAHRPIREPVIADRAGSGSAPPPIRDPFFVTLQGVSSTRGVDALESKARFGPDLRRHSNDCCFTRDCWILIFYIRDHFGLRCMTRWDVAQPRFESDQSVVHESRSGNGDGKNRPLGTCTKPTLTVLVAVIECLTATADEVSGRFN